MEEQGMERNPNDNLTSTSTSGSDMGSTSGASGAAGSYGSGSTAGAYGSGAGDTGMGTSGSAATNTGIGGASMADAGTSGMSGGTSGGGQGRTEQLKETAQEKAAQAREALGTAGSKARDWKQSLEQTLADRLETGASRLRSRNAPNTGSDSPAFAYASGGASSATSEGNGQMTRVASGLDATADWLRNGDLKATVEEQARTNPGRTLLVALGVGYLLGKALRR
jgi:hypothetical protein